MDGNFPVSLYALSIFRPLAFEMRWEEMGRRESNERPKSGKGGEVELDEENKLSLSRS